MPYSASIPASGRSPAREGSLVHLLLRRAQERPDAPLYRFLDHGEREGVTVTCGDLDRRARSVAAALQEAGCGGERVLLLFPPGAAFFAAFFGCLYAGAVAVPVYPPRPNDRRLERLDAVAGDCDARGVLTVAALRPRVEEWAAGATSPVVLAADEVTAGPDDWRPPELRLDTLALLQYTSGSTAAPRGVVVTHAHLLENSACIDAGFRHDADSVIVNWLPTFHDMGLVYGVVQPLYAGVPAVHMSPLAFLQRPARWLRAVSRYRGTHSGGPNFGYDLCLRKVRPEREEELDLSSWRVAYNGSEPVRADTLERFAAAFAAHGFHAEALCPAYGMAETTLKISSASPGQPVTVLSVDGTALEEDRVAPVPPGTPWGRRLVGCGPVGDGLEVRIVEPEAAAPCPADRIGEIWVRGASVAAGYFGRPDDTARVFGGELPEEGGGWLRTGDLGFVHGGEVYVTGRLKDLIILQGRNHYPQDFERTAEESHPELRRGCCAAFGVDGLVGEEVVVAVEVARRFRGDAGEVRRAVRQALSRDHDVSLREVVLLTAGSVPKTSSGKIRRGTCRRAYLDGTLETL